MMQWTEEARFPLRCRRPSGNRDTKGLYIAVVYWLAEFGSHPVHVEPRACHRNLHAINVLSMSDPPCPIATRCPYRTTESEGLRLD